MILVSLSSNSYPARTHSQSMQACANTGWLVAKDIWQQQSRGASDLGHLPVPWVASHLHCTAGMTKLDHWYSQITFPCGIYMRSWFDISWESHWWCLLTHWPSGAKTLLNAVVRLVVEQHCTPLGLTTRISSVSNRRWIQPQQGENAAPSVQAKRVLEVGSYASLPFFFFKYSNNTCVCVCVVVNFSWGADLNKN